MWSDKFFDVYTLSIAEYENEEIPKIYLTTEEHPWDSSTNEYLERETQIKIIEVRSSFLPQQQGDQYMSVQFSHSPWLMMLMM